LLLGLSAAILVDLMLLTSVFTLLLLLL